MRYSTIGVFALAVALGSGSLSAQAVLPEALVIAPEPGERVPANEVFVAVSFIDPAGTLDPLSVALRVSGQDVTAQAQVRGGVLTWRPMQPLPTGLQRVVVTARDRSGAEIPAANWAFNVAEAVAAPAGAGVPVEATGGALRSVHGSLIVEGAGQSVSGPGAPGVRNEDFLPRMWLSAAGLISPGWRYAARMHVSGYESSNAQPVNRYRVDLRAPFFNISAGDVNPVYSDLILAGRRVRGAQGELKLGPVQIAAVGGESRRAIDGMISAADPRLVLRQGSFGQRLYAIRPAIGSGVHFQLGLTAMRVKDDVGSIMALRTQPSPTGSSQSANPAPKDNVVAGADLTVRLAGGRVMLQYQNAASLLANDISTGALTERGLDSIMDALGEDRLGIDPSQFEKYFTINASLIPLNPTGMTSVAQQVRGALRVGRHMVSSEWRSIGGAYYTLGYPSLQRDLMGFRIADSFTAVGDALAMTVGFQRDEDNLDNTKTATTSTSDMFLSGNWQDTPDGVMVAGSVRMGTRSNNLRVGQDGALDEQSLSLSAGVSFEVPVMPALNTRLSLNGAMIERKDPLNPQRGTRDMYYLAGLQGETDSRQSTMALLFGMNQSDLTGFAAENTNLFRVIGSARHRFLPEWSALFDGSYTGASSDDASVNGPRYTRLEALGGLELEWRATTVVTLTGGLIDYADERFTTRDTRELVARLRVSRNF